MGNDKKSEATEIVTAALLVIGDEILSGRTRDSNIHYLANHLTEIGVRLQEVRVVGDDEAAIITALNALRPCYTYVFTTGGIGPTHDDITAQSVARALDLPLVLDEGAVDMMAERYGRAQLTETQMRMAYVPQGADLIENSVSFAPGFMIRNVIVMAGVPVIMQVMLDAVTPRLKTGKKMHSVTIIVDRKESLVAKNLEDVQKEYPTISMGSYPFFKNDRPGTQLVLRSTDAAQLKIAEAELVDRLDALGYLQSDYK